MMDESVFVDEIAAQPQALRDLASYYQDAEGQARLREAVAACGNRRLILFTGMGSSLYAPRITYRELVSLGPTILLMDAGELLHFGMEQIHGQETLIAISQSGESAETRQVVQQAKGRVPILAIVHDQASSVGAGADTILPIRSGEERSISSKSYTNTLAVLLLLSDALRGRDTSPTLEQLRHLADLVEHTLEHTDQQARRAVDFFGALSNIHFIGRGADLATAEQWALIIKEGADVFSETLSAGMFRHGPIELAGAGHAAAFICSRPHRPELTCGLAREVAEMGSKVLVLSDTSCKGNANLLNVVLPNPSPRCFPLLCAPFIELFVHHMANLRGRCAGVFRNSMKVTMRE